MGEFTHFNEQGHAVMVDVSEKSDTVREATAMGRISMSQECFEKVKTGGVDSAVPYPESEQGYDRI